MNAINVIQEQDEGEALFLQAKQALDTADSRIIKRRSWLGTIEALMHAHDAIMKLLCEYIAYRIETHEDYEAMGGTLTKGDKRELALMRQYANELGIELDE